MTIYSMIKPELTRRFRLLSTCIFNNEITTLLFSVYSIRNQECLTFFTDFIIWWGFGHFGGQSTVIPNSLVGVVASKSSPTTTEGQKSEVVPRCFSPNVLYPRVP